MTWNETKQKFLWIDLNTLNRIEANRMELNWPALQWIALNGWLAGWMDVRWFYHTRRIELCRDDLLPFQGFVAGLWQFGTCLKFWGSHRSPPETCFHLHLHTYTTQWMVGKWFCISKSSAFRLRSCEEKMFIAFWRFLRRNNFNSPTRCWNAQPRTGVALVDAGFSLVADAADRLTRTETGLHTWLVLWDVSPLKKVRFRRQIWDLGNGRVTRSTCRMNLCARCIGQTHLLAFFVLFPCSCWRLFRFLDFFWCVLPEPVCQNFFSKRLIDETFSFLGQIFLHCINATGDDFILGPRVFCSAYAFLFVFSHPLFLSFIGSPLFNFHLFGA